MAYYTALLKDCCEELARQKGDYKTIIPIARPLVFDFDYEFWNPSGKSAFEELFLKHFYMRELGIETYYYWKMRLDDKFNTILPNYNIKFKTLAKEFDPLITDIESITIHKTGSTNDKEDRSRDITAGSTSTGSSSTNSSGNTEETNSKLPMGQLTNFRDDKYLSDATKSSNSNTASGTNSTTINSINNSTDDITRQGSMIGDETRTISGTHYNQSELIEKYLSLQRNLTMDFFRECEDLFMALWR